METSEEFLKKVWDYANECHASTNHLYGGTRPYSYHLDMADEAWVMFADCLPKDAKIRNIVRAAIRCHDVEEDTRQTFNDVKKVAGEEVAEIVHAVTNEKGKNRKERANAKYYEGIKNTPYATFVKLCDRIANVQHSKKEKSSMFNKYREEHYDFYASLYEPNTPYEPMWDYLRELFND